MTTTIHPFRFSAQRPATVTWQSRLNGATDQEDVMAIARDFVAQFDHSELACLPARCRPGKFFDANDVAGYAITLIRHCTGGDTEGELRVEKLAAFFSQASTRLARILSVRTVSRDHLRQVA